ncbi:benzoate 4-monooxygenase cytochrome P450 [Diaporthe amygdali]|uniref:benzoate 4-monooxygenase cytochrome P450 n=1 Tax=Phomopsis amygdali TaxID=1214568 RepID=UPI0022FECEB0|nr:benzoate 4-monooxygenase cytochrome P450 [Diaporthe amygdali]KAJ0109551.1 benzoate 4-monooxygenase cytochrome P450 [Diaporthe amygdali]
MGSLTTPEYDAIIVGGGFAGCYTLDRLRKAGFKTLVIDDAANLGGVWYWNCYAGARVDTSVPLYEFSDEEIWRPWTWSERYPGRDEIRNYFDHVESKLHLKKDFLFNKLVVSAEFDEGGNHWSIVTGDKSVLTSRFFILCTGFAAKPNIPDFKGLDSFARISCHTSKWPQGGIDFKGKRVGVVGNGSSGLQVIQEFASEVDYLTVFQRSPTYALPMRQKHLSAEDQQKETYRQLYELRKKTFAGLDFEFKPHACGESTAAEREAFFEELWAKGGLSFWLGTYQDVIRDKEANQHAYEFWRSKVLQRVHKPAMQQLLAPEKKPYYFGTKRATLEQRYYEVYNQDNVELIDAKANAITEVVPDGIFTADGKLHKLDVLVLATGFDSVTGGILAIDIKGENGQSLRKKWAKGTTAHLGMTTAGFPNALFVYGPQGPTSFCNGPTCAELQGDWIRDTLVYLREHGKCYIDPRPEAEQEWRELVNNIGDATLLPQTKSEYMGTNIPGKPKETEMLNFLGGVVEYTRRITSSLSNGLENFVVRLNFFGRLTEMLLPDERSDASSEMNSHAGA